MKTITPIRSREFKQQNSARQSPNKIIGSLKMTINLQSNEKKRFESVKLAPYLSDFGAKYIRFLKKKDMKQQHHNQQREIKKALQKQSSCKRFRIQQLRFNSTRKILSKDSIQSSRSFEHFYQPNCLQQTHNKFRQSQFSSQLYQKLKPKRILQNKFHQNKTSISLKKIKPQKTTSSKHKNFRQNKFQNIQSNSFYQKQEPNQYQSQQTETIQQQMKIKMREQIDKQLQQSTKQYFLSHKKSIKSNNEIQQYLSTLQAPYKVRIEQKQQQKERNISKNKIQSFITYKPLDYNFNVEEQIYSPHLLQQQSITTQNNQFSSFQSIQQNNNIEYDIYK